MSIESLERAVIEKLLDGDEPLLLCLRAQVTKLKVASREFTGAGFYTEFDSLGCEEMRISAESKIRFGDVVADLPALKNGIGFLLYVDNGLIHVLEGYTFGEDWPEDVSGFALRYLDQDRTSELSKLKNV
jgi:hypothetical protein